MHRMAPLILLALAACIPAAAAQAEVLPEASTLPASDVAPAAPTGTGCLGLSDEPLCESSVAASLDGDEPGPLNVDGTTLRSCGHSPMTGFHRDGLCRTSTRDGGVHVVCAEMTREFLDFTRAAGNDLETPAPRFDFPGLVPGDNWCLCASRWEQARKAGVAPPVVHSATEASALRFTTREHLDAHRVASN